MFSNYLKVALRTLARQRLYSAINVLSLAVGIAFCALAFLHIRSEWSADRFHEHADNIYRVHRVENRANGTTKHSAGVSAPLGTVIRDEVPNVEHTVRMRSGQVQVRLNDDVRVEPILFADPAFFDMFTFPLRSAGPTPLQSPGDVVLSAAAAERMFGDEDPTGRIIDIRLADEPRSFTIAGVAEPIPANSSITFEFVVAYENWPGFDQASENWGAFNSAVYVELGSGSQENAAQAQLDLLVDRYYSAMIAEAQNAGWLVAGDEAFDLQLQPLREVHFSEGFTNMVASTRNAGSLYVLGGICLVVLLLACVNFMTLAAGRAGGRAREVGVRKSLGALRGQLTTQFFAEALLLAGIALAFGIGLAVIALPRFNELLAINVTFAAVDALFIGGMVVLTAISGLLAGAYPALVLSRVGPAEVLKGRLNLRFGLSFTQVLVVVQFAISIGMIACMLVMYGQLDFLQTKDLGFNESGVVAVDLQAGQTDEELLLDRFRQQVAAEAASLQVTGASYGFDGGWSRFVMTENERQAIVYNMRVDPEYLGAMNIQLAAGRNLSAEFGSDAEQAALVNEALVQAFRWEEPIGRILPGFEEEGVVIVGVVEDYHFESLRDEIAPVILHMNPALGSVNHALIRLPGQDVAANLARIQSAWTTVAPDQPFEYAFLDARLAERYQAERRWTLILRTSAAFALLIACLGLFGLAVLSVERRRKEIGVRKVLGATATRVVLLLSKDFARLVGIAFLVVTPIAYLIMTRWLDGFAYHESLGAGSFIVAGIIALAVALATVSVQSIRAALRDPVRSLRQEA